MELLDLGQPPLGLLETNEFLECTRILGVGEKIVLYTDGVSEARDDEMFGIEGITQCLSEHAGLSVEDLVDRLIGAARERANGRMQDDVAVVALHRLIQS